MFWDKGIRNLSVSILLLLHMNAHVDVLIWDAQDSLAEKRGFVRTWDMSLCGFQWEVTVNMQLLFAASYFQNEVCDGQSVQCVLGINEGREFMKSQWFCVAQKLHDILCRLFFWPQEPNRQKTHTQSSQDHKSTWSHLEVIGLDWYFAHKTFCSPFVSGKSSCAYPPRCERWTARLTFRWMIPTPRSRVRKVLPRTWRLWQEGGANKNRSSNNVASENENMSMQHACCYEPPRKHHKTPLMQCNVDLVYHLPRDVFSRQSKEILKAPGHPVVAAGWGKFDRETLVKRSWSR